MDYTTYIIKDLKVFKWCSISPDLESDESKTFKVELTIDNVTINDMANGLLKGEVIRFQNAKRKSYDKLIDKSTHKVAFKKPIATIDPVDAMRADALASGVDINDTDALTIYIMERLSKATK